MKYIVVRVVIPAIVLFMAGFHYFLSPGNKVPDTSPGASVNSQGRPLSPESKVTPEPEKTDNSRLSETLSETKVAESPSPDIDLSEEELQTLLNEHPKALEMKIFAEDAFIRKFKQLSEKKALLSREDVAELDRMLQDQEAITSIEFMLSSPMHQENFLKEQMERMFYIDFLKACLEKKDNAAGELIRTRIRTIILSDNLNPDLPLNMRKSIAAEKAELIALLSEHDPASLEILRSQASGLRHHKLLRHYLGPEGS